jgi:type VI secretion system protein ImpC
MAEMVSFSGVESELVSTLEELDTRVSDDVPFRVLLIGDWSGRGNRRLSAASEELKGWRPLLVDRDNLDQLIARLGVRLSIPLTGDGSQELTIRFNELNDFHPDRLFQRLEIFDDLRRTRINLANPKTFAKAAREFRALSTPATAKGFATESPGGNKSAEPTAEPQALQGNLIDQILAGGIEAVPVTKPSEPFDEISPEISELARAVVKPHLTPDIEADQDQLLNAVDACLAATMNAILHHPDFQATESAWRALDFLVTRLDTGSDLKLYLLDISFDEFKDDLRSNQIGSTALYKLLVEQTMGTSGGIPWAVLAGNYTFDFASNDASVIEPVSMIAREAGAPFVAGTTPHLLGCSSLVETPDPDDWRLPVAAEIEEWWRHVTGIPSAAYVGLALPRFLLRLPYGRATDPIEKFDFEEHDSNKRLSALHDSYLWANPAFAVAYLLSQGFSKNGWNFRPGDVLEIEGLPLHVHESDGESAIKPGAEVLLTVRAAEKIIDRGLMPLLTMKDSDTVRLGMLQSIGGRRLRGPWVKES